MMFYKDPSSLLKLSKLFISLVRYDNSQQEAQFLLLIISHDDTLMLTPLLMKHIFKMSSTNKHCMMLRIVSNPHFLQYYTILYACKSSCHTQPVSLSYFLLYPNYDSKQLRRIIINNFFVKLSCVAA